MSDPFDLHGRLALVTGASRGIGLAVAQALAARGAALVLTGRKLDALTRAAESLQANGATVHPFACHQGDPTAIEGLFAALDERGIVPDLAVVNAGINPVFGPLVDLEVGAWQKILDVNLTGAFLTARGAIRRMVPRGRGAVVFMASVAALEPMEGLGAYSASKAGLLGLMRALAKEVGSAGVRVNAIAPGLVETRFADALFRDQAGYDALMARTPLGRHGQPDDVAQAVVFLMSEAAKWITGQTLVIDGGARV